MSDSKVNVLCRFVHNLYVKMSQISHTFISDHKAFCGDVQSLQYLYTLHQMHTTWYAMGPYCLEECLQTTFTLETTVSQSKLVPMDAYALLSMVT